MAKQMTAEQIESELHALTHEHPTISAIRQAFTLGQDNGKAIILERAETILPTANLELEAIGRALMIVVAWLSVDSGRSFQGVRRTENNDKHSWVAAAMRSDVDKARESSDTWSEFKFGSTPVEAMAKLATWCVEHAIAWPKAPARIVEVPYTECDIAIATSLSQTVVGTTVGTYERMLSATGRADTEPPPPDLDSRPDITEERLLGAEEPTPDTERNS